MYKMFLHACVAILVIGRGVEGGTVGLYNNRASRVLDGLDKDIYEPPLSLSLIFH